MTSDLSGRTTVVVGASRGLGRGIATAFAEAGAPVVAVARTGAALAELATTNSHIRTEAADPSMKGWHGTCSTSTTRRFSSWSPAPTQ